MIFGSDSIQVTTTQRLRQHSVPATDSIQVRKATGTKQPASIYEERRPVAKPQTNPPSSTPAATAVSKKPKPPVKTELSAASTNSKNDVGTLVGSFDTNLPTFNELNMQNKKAIAEAGGVGIYGDGEVNVTHQDGPPPTESVIFPGKNVSVSFPTPEPPAKGSIVYDAEAKTYAFNNIEGLQLTSKPKEGGGGENFLISGGTIEKLDTGENNKEGSDRLPQYNTRPQTIVLMDTQVKDGAITVANDRIIANKNTEMNTDTINTIAKSANGNKYTSSSIVYEGHNDVKNTQKMQSGYTMSSAYTNWLGGSEKDLKSLKTTETLGTVDINNDAFAAINNIKNKAPARTIGNLNIYTTSGNGDDLKAIDNGNGTITLNFRHDDNTRVTIPKEQAEGAQIYYDKNSNTMYMENLKGVSMNTTKNGGHYDMQINLAIKDCHFKYLNTMETTTANGVDIANASTGEKKQSNIAILGKSIVDKMFATYDNIFLDKSSTVGTFAGVGNNTTENLAEQNKVTFENRSWLKQNGKIYFKADLSSLPKEVRDAFSASQTNERK